MTITTPPLTEETMQFLLSHHCILEDTARTVTIHFPAGVRSMQYADGQRIIFPDGNVIRALYYPAHEMHVLMLGVPMERPALTDTITDIRERFGG